ncbi:MAG: peptidase prolyl oligopeptidase active site domain protein, partial [Candidatus Eremiobacteraeota bacterium]|nr:peptidase prolyl oligopeptidase active site domain protein [Candidatus Eremiobacteraeota bacterium]
MTSPLVPSDLLDIVLVSDPQIAPDGSAVYYRRSWFDRESDEVRGAIRRVEKDGADRAFTAGPNDRLPRVAPDRSAVAFVGDRDEKTCLCVLRLDGGEAMQLAEYAKIVALAWSPDAKRIAFVATAPFDAPSARAFHDEKTGARHIRMLPFKSDADGLLDGVRKHLFVIDVTDGAVARQVTSGDYDVNAPSWSPDGTKIAFSARIGGSDLETPTALSDIHVVDVASGAVTTITAGDGPMVNPVYSHDGKEIAFAGHRNGDDGGGRFDTELLMIPAGGGPIRSLSSGLGRTVGNAVGGDQRSGAAAAPAWSADDREILIQVCDEGSTSVRAFARDGGGTRVVASGERDVFGFSASDGGALAIAYSTPTVPAEVALIEPYGGERKLTDANPWLAQKTVVAPKRYRPRAADGTVLDAWLIAPAARNEAKPPLVLEVHGGPHAAYGHTFFLEFQVLAAQGIAVAYGNPRGSQSYGHAYANAILGDWGGIDAGDVLAILDGALAQGEFDTARIGVAGGSYGGFMTTWLMGHSDRFSAGVSMRAVNDFVSEIGASDIGWFLEKEMQAFYAADAGRKLFEGSPM